MSFLLKKNAAATGVLGENIATHYLTQRGYTILARNLTNNLGRRIGEIDLIAMKERVLIFVEVKTQQQKADHIMRPEGQITRSKLRKLDKIAQFYIRKHAYWDYAYRFDAIAIIINPQETTSTVRHLKNIFI